VNIEATTQELKFEIQKPTITIEEAVKIEILKHQELSRTASAGMFKGGLADSGEQTTRLHTSAHLMLAALRQVLGDHVGQKGSNITAERLRFDVSHPQKITAEELQKVEYLVNEQIAKNIPVEESEMSLEEAKKQNATGAFENKCGDRVKVYTIGNFSKEICGGPHVKNTGELGKFEITKEESSSSGVRRIKAVLS
jgi:alanyl-tRNA synthetase